MEHIAGAWPASFEDLIAKSQALSPSDRAKLAYEVSERDRKDRELKQRLHLLDLARKNSDLGERFSDRTFATYAVPPGDMVALEKAQAVAAEPYETGLWLGSKTKGNGKTHLVAAIANDCMDRGIACTFLSVTRFIDRLKDSYDRKGNAKSGASDIIGALAAVPVLILDDLDKPKPTEWFCERMYRLINDRYENKRQAIVTVNATRSEIQEAWATAGGDRGEAVIDRLVEMCTLKHRVDGSSFRGTV